MESISPKYLMDITQKINDRLYEMYQSDCDVQYYVKHWQEEYDDYGYSNFDIQYQTDDRERIDLKKTLHNVDGETLLKMAIDLGLETPDFIPSIPSFKNELKSSYKTAAQTFEKAYCNAQKDPSLAVGLANSALEAILKEIIKDSRIDIQYDEKDNLYKLIKKVTGSFSLGDPLFPKEAKKIASSLISCCNAIEDIRSTKTEMHGKTDDDLIINNPLYAYLIINAVSTVGLFLLNYYKIKYPPEVVEESSEYDPNDLPF